MEKAIEIKRRAQRCILNGDLDGALNEYEKLIASGDNDPYHSVLLADLLYKKGDHVSASERYLEAVLGYENVGLHKNAIAVCKKMSRLALTPGPVLLRLARLHAVDGLSTESSLYFMQHAELMLADGKFAEAAKSLREAFEVCPDNVRVLEQLAELQEQSGSSEPAAKTLIEAAAKYEGLGHLAEAKRCLARAAHLAPGVAGLETVASASAGPASVTAFTASASTLAPSRSTAPAPPSIPTVPVGHATAVPRGTLSPSEVALQTGPPAGSMDFADATPLAPEPPGYDETPIHKIDLDEGQEAGGDGLDLGNGMPTLSPAESMALGAHPSQQADEASTAFASAEAESIEAALGGLEGSSPPAPGLAFDGAAASRPAPAAAPQPVASASDTEETAESIGVSEVSQLLEEAQALFKSGHREEASGTLVRAAQAYDHLGRLDSAASIYRSLSQVSEAPLQVMMLWLKNCQRRDDPREAARVACELGDRALFDGDKPAAREWFERARSYDSENELAGRRLQRLNAEAATGVAAVAAPSVATPPAIAAPSEPAPVAAAPAPAKRAARPGLVEVSLDDEEPVGLDLGTLIADFQRGLEEQLDSDPQGHYDLGMSYREMGLFDHAILSFRIASNAPEFSVRSSEMIGRCLLDQGDFDGAVEELARTLTLPELTAVAAFDIRYQLGLAFEVGGRLAEALQQFEKVYASEPNYPDVAAKIRALRKMLEQD